MRVSGIGFLPVRNLKNNVQKINLNNGSYSLAFLSKVSNESDSFETAKTQTKEVQNLMSTKEEVYPYYIVSKPIEKRERTLAADEQILKKGVVLVLNKSTALNLSEQDFIKTLKNGETVRLSSSKKAKDAIYIPTTQSDSEEDDFKIALEITKIKDSIYVTDYSLSTNVGIAYSEHVNDSNAFNFLKAKKLDNLQTLADSKAKALYKEEAYRLIPGDTVEICPVEDLDSAIEVFILPGDIIFKIADQEKIKQLKNQEQLVIGRKPLPEPDDTDKDKTTGRINTANTKDFNIISRNHLIVKNDDGIIYVTDVSLNGTKLAKENWIRPKRGLLDIAKATLKDWF